MRDWIFGEIVSTGHSRIALAGILKSLFERGGQPVGYAQLARDAGLANNTVASGYIEQLSDLLCVMPSWPWDVSTKKLVLRRPCKFHFINLAAVVALHPAMLRSVADFKALPPQTQGTLMEWFVAQEMWRRESLRDMHDAEAIGFWSNKSLSENPFLLRQTICRLRLRQPSQKVLGVALLRLRAFCLSSLSRLASRLPRDESGFRIGSKEHEIDFVTPSDALIEVKRGKAGPLDFTWFPQMFGNKELTVICQTPFSSRYVRGITLEDFLLQG